MKVGDNLQDLCIMLPLTITDHWNLTLHKFFEQQRFTYKEKS